MADFDQAFQYLIPDEGGYVNNPADPGGETYMGIARAKQPGWDGWIRVDALKSHPQFPAFLNADDQVQQAVRNFYRRVYWVFDGITNQEVASKLFDEAVNMEGSGSSGNLIKCAQLAARYLSGQPVQIDSQWGPQTEALINSLDPAKFLGELRAQLALFYCKLGNPNFLLGWLRRATR